MRRLKLKRFGRRFWIMPGKISTCHVLTSKATKSDPLVLVTHIPGGAASMVLRWKNRAADFVLGLFGAPMSE